MYHQSTIYIRDDLFRRLMEAAELLGIRRSRLVEALLIRYMDGNRAGKKFLKMQRYQKIKKGTKCGRMCVFWRRDVYERSCDVRKAFKMSVSFVIAEAIERYIDEVIEDMQNCHSKGKTYNYNGFYFISAKYYDNSYLTATIWNDPGPKILKKVYKLTK